MPGLYVNNANGPRPGRLRLAAGDFLGGSDAVYLDEPRDESSNREDCVSVLTRMVEGEIIPRLLLAHQATRFAPPMKAPEPAFGPDMTDEFARLALSSETDICLTFVDTLLARGATFQAIYMDLLAPAARRIGDYWTDDRCSFTDVTIALGRLQQVLHELSRRSPLATLTDRGGRSALLAAAPGEQHTFGLLLVEEYFRRAGWRTWCETNGLASDVTRMVSTQWFDVLGLTVSCDTHLDQVAAMITSVRNISKNRAIRVMVGGRLLTEFPELASIVGADVTASTGDEAVALAESAVRQLEGRC